MAKRKDTEAASPEIMPAQSTPKSELSTVESPSISPATPEPKIEPAVEPVAEIAPVVEPVVTAAPETTPVAETSAAPTAKLFVLRPRHKRYALLAASVTIAAAFGAIFGAIAGGGFSTPTPQVDVAAVQERQERQAMQQTLAKLNKEIGTLKTSLETANKSAHQQIAKITERFDRAASAELITGSISAPQTTAPLPTPRPAPRISAAEAQATAPPQVVQGWTVRDARDGFVYVQSNGEVYQVVPGAPLPGLGPVESVKRLDGRWVVKTPKGIIVSLRDRRYFE